MNEKEIQVVKLSLMKSIKLLSDFLGSKDNQLTNYVLDLSKEIKELFSEKFFKEQTILNQPLEDIFNKFSISEIEGDYQTNRYYEPIAFGNEDKINFSKENISLDLSSLRKRFNKLMDILTTIGLDKIDINQLLSIMEEELSYVQSPIEDASLYDYAKLMSAIDLTWYQYNQNSSVENTSFDSNKPFSLISFDISGIQDFIYTIATSRAAKMLRARSFYLEILSEHLIEEILSRCHLTRANLIYNGGGHAYIIGTNSQDTHNQLKAIQEEINAFLLKNYEIKLYIAFGIVPFSKDVILGNQQEYSNLYKELSEVISKNKLNRYDFESILRLNENGKKEGKTCSVCHTISKLDDDLCTICQKLIEVSPKLMTADQFSITSNSSGLPIGFNRYLEMGSKKDAIFIFNKNKKADFGIPIWMGDYNVGKTYEQYTEQDIGIKRLGVLRCDVDNLGEAFINGFSKESASFLRSATFSRQMSLFFKYHINHILSKQNTNGTIIYAGGDDVFVVGQWGDMIDFSIELRNNFIRFTQGKLTLSSGFGLYPAKFPISVMAKETGNLESYAKDLPDKNGISLFDKNYTFKWNRFIDGVINEKYRLIENYLEKINIEINLKNSFIYHLLELINNSFAEVRDSKRGERKTISWARWVYYLVRMEPEGNENKEVYRELTQKLNQYFKNEVEVKELQCALILYVYHNRGGEI